MAEKPTQQINPGTALAPGYMAAQPDQPPPPPDHGVTEADLAAMSLAQLADLIEANEMAYDNLTDATRAALVRLLRATTET